MTKHEVKEYLTKIYGMEIYKVETANFLGTYTTNQIVSLTTPSVTFFYSTASVQAIVLLIFLYDFVAHLSLIFC